MKKNNKKLKEFQDYAIMFAESFFNDFFDHPEWRGKSFSWDEFPNMVKRYCYVQCPLSFSNLKKNEIEFISEQSKLNAIKLIKEHQVI
jgi:hypothetical protein